MENKLIELYLFICQIYDTRLETCFQRASNNRQPKFTDQELVCIWFFGHLNQKFNKRQIYDFIRHYWADWFPRLPKYQTFSYRLNLLEQTFQTIGAELFTSPGSSRIPEADHLIDSFPVMPASGGHDRPERGSVVKSPMSVIAPPRKPIFTGCVCTPLPGDVSPACRTLHKCGSVKHHITTRLPPVSNISNCQTPV